MNALKFKRVMEVKATLHSYINKRNLRLLKTISFEKDGDINAVDGAGRTALHCAVLDQWEAGVCELLRRGADVKAKDSEGNSPLYFACSVQHHGIVQILLYHGANVNSKNCKLQTPLYIAVLLDDAHLANMLLENGADINNQDKNGDSILSKYCKSNKNQMLKFLLDNESNIELKNNSGLSPLLISCKVGNVEAVKELLSRRADVHCKDVEGNTALHFASRLESPEIVEVLLDAGSGLECRNEHKETPLLYALKYFNQIYSRGVPDEATYERVVLCLIQRGAKVNVWDRDKMMPLFYAIQLKSVTLVRKLLVHGAEVNAKNYRKDTPLHLVCIHMQGFDEVAQELMVYGAKVNVRNKRKETPLHIAALNGDKKTMITLLKEGADVNLKNKRQNTPLLQVDAWDQNIESLVSLLLKYNANPNECDKYYMENILMSAVQANNLALVKLLLSTEIDVNAQNVSGNTALTIASKYRNHLGVVEELLEKGANVNLANKEGNTPLFYAARLHRNRSAVELLLKYGPNVNHKNVKGVTALHVASECSGTDVIEQLLSAGACVKTVDNEGNTPLLSCAKGCCDKEVVDLLLRYGSNVHHTNLQGASALHYVVDSGAAKSLMLAGCNVNEEDNNGNSPLHSYLRYNCFRLECLSEFLSWGSSVIKLNKVKISPIGLIPKLRFSKRKEIGTRIKKHIVLSKCASLSLEPPLDVNMHIGFDHLSGFQEKCLQEVDRMKARRVGGVCVFDILSKYRDPTYLCNSELEGFVKSLGQQPREFPIYESVLIATYRRATHRQALMNKAQSVLAFPLHTELVREILSYLEDRHLTILAKD